jgi:hypothetical protein
MEDVEKEVGSGKLTYLILRGFSGVEQTRDHLIFLQRQPTAAARYQIQNRMCRNAALRKEGSI